MDELEMKQNEEQKAEVVDTEVPLDKNLRLMSPTMMVVRRFFRSKLSIVGLVMVIALFLFSFVGPLFLSEIPTTKKNGTTFISDVESALGEGTTFTVKIRR